MPRRCRSGFATARAQACGCVVAVPICAAGIAIPDAAARCGSCNSSVGCGEHVALLLVLAGRFIADRSGDPDDGGLASAVAGHVGASNLRRFPGLAGKLWTRKGACTEKEARESILSRWCTAMGCGWPLDEKREPRAANSAYFKCGLSWAKLRLFRRRITANSAQNFHRCRPEQHRAAGSHRGRQRVSSGKPGFCDAT